MADDILVATKTAVLVHDGRRVTITAGRTHVRAGHPIATSHPQMFAPVPLDFDTETPTPPHPPKPAPKPARTPSARGKRRTAKTRPDPPHEPTPDETTTPDEAPDDHTPRDRSS